MKYVLSAEQVKAIKTGRASGKTYFELGEEFGITFQHAQAICSGKRRESDLEPDLPGERWKEVPSLPVIQASSLGRIKRVETQKLLSCRSIKRTGYLQVGFSYNSKKMNRLAHRLIAEAWLGPCPKGMQVNHKDGNKTNNRIENLEYVTPSRNNKHAYEIGLKSAEGENNGRSKLTKNVVLEIRRRADSGEHYRDLAMEYNISPQHAHAIILRKFWKHI